MYKSADRDYFILVTWGIFTYWYWITPLGRITVEYPIIKKGRSGCMADKYIVVEWVPCIVGD